MRDSWQFRYRSLCSGQCMGIFPEGATVDFYGFLGKAGVVQATVRSGKANSDFFAFVLRTLCSVVQYP